MTQQCANNYPKVCHKRPKHVPTIAQKCAQNDPSVKKEFEGYKLGVLSSNTEALNLIPLEKIEEFDMMNGSIDCKYQLFKA